jgi:thioredoxin-related protein
LKIKFLIVFFFISIFSFSQKWEETYDAAKSKVEESGGAILLVFAGSDWCAPCIKLDRLVFQSPKFDQFAKENLTLYKADFPRKKANSLDDELTTTNKLLAEKFNPKGYFPLVVLLDSEEKVLGSFGYQRKSVEDYISQINSLLK